MGSFALQAGGDVGEPGAGAGAIAPCGWSGGGFLPGEV